MSANLPFGRFSVSTVVGWLLAVAAVAAGYVGWGWRGVALALTVIVFWLLLQFSRALRVMRNAAARPKGAVESAVMFNAKLQPGLRLAQIMALTGSFGDKAGEAPETYRWRDAGGDEVLVELDAAGRLARWALKRADAAQDAA
jgi:hypothetical protein